MNLDKLRSRAQQRARGEYRSFEHVRPGICFLQHDQNIANADGATVRADVNNALVSLFSLSSGATAPATTIAYQLWADTTSGTLKQRNAANTGWIVRRTLDESFVLSRASNTILDISDVGKTIRATSSFTQTYDAAATLGDGWFARYVNEGTGNITHDPNGAETIDGVATKIQRPGETWLIVCNGTNLKVLPLYKFQGAVAVGRNIAAQTGAAGSPTLATQIVSISADELQLEDGNGNSFVARSVLVDVDITAAGANGLDTGAEASGTWYYGWVIAKEDGTVAGLLSVSATAPTMPSGYTYKALVTAVRNNGSSNFIAFRQMGNRVHYLAEQATLTSGSATSETSFSVAAAVPPIAQDMDLAFDCYTLSDGAGQVQGSFRIGFIAGNILHSHLFLLTGLAGSATTRVVNGTMPNVPNVAQTLYYQWTRDVGAGSETGTVNITGFTLPCGGN